MRRVVLASFRARRVRDEGVAVFGFWRDWAHWRALERRAIVAYWHKIMLLVSTLLMFTPVSRTATGHCLFWRRYASVTHMTDKCQRGHENKEQPELLWIANKY